LKSTETRDPIYVSELLKRISAISAR